MRLIEADAKQMLWRRGLRVPAGAQLYREADPVRVPDAPVVVKAQLLEGNRAAGGLIKLAQADEAVEAARTVSQRMAAAGSQPLLLIEGQVSIAAEYFVAWRIDDLRQRPSMMFSSSGGTGIESRADAIAEYGHAARRELLPSDLIAFLRERGVPAAHLGAIARFCVGLYEAFCAEDALLLEVNPLAITTTGEAVALDAKMVTDDNAASRHLEWKALPSAALQSDGDRELELAAARAGFTYVELPGRVALFSAGAGLGMCVVDVLADAGMPAANFCDATGGPGGAAKWARMTEIVFERARDPEVEAILFFFVLTATPIKSVLSGLFESLDKAPAPKPLVVGLVCAAAAEQEMSFAEAREALRSRGYECVTDLREALEALERVVGAKTVKQP